MPVAAANPAVETGNMLPDPHLGLRPFGAVAAVTLCGIVAFLNLYSTQPLLPLFRGIFRTSEAAVGLTVSASTFGVALGAPLFGFLAERLNRKRVIVWSACAVAIPTFLAATAPGLHWLIFWRFLQGLALPGIFTMVITYVGEEWRRESIALVMSFYISGTAMGGFLGRLVAGVAADTLGWRWSFVLLGLAMLLGAALIARLLPPERRPAHAVPSHAQPEGFWLAFRHFRNPRLLATFAVGFGMLFILVATFSYSTFYLANPPFRLSTLALSYLFAVYLIGLAVTPLGGFLVTHIGMRRGMMVALAASLLGEALTLSHSLWIVILPGLGLVCAGVFVAQTTATSFLRMAAPPGGRVSAAGLYLSCYYIGGTLGAVVPSYFWSMGGWRACVFLSMAVLLATLGITLAGWRETAWSTH